MARPKVDTPKAVRTIRLSEIMITKIEEIAAEKGYTSVSDFARYLFQREIEEHEKRKQAQP